MYHNVYSAVLRHVLLDPFAESLTKMEGVKGVFPPNFKHEAFMKLEGHMRF